MANLYFKYRFFYFNDGQGRYSPSYLFNQQRPDYTSVTIKDFIIHDEKYNEGVHKRLMVIECPDEIVEDIKYDFNEFYKPLYNLAELTPQQAIDFVKENTILTEISEGNFELSPAVEASEWIEAQDAVILSIV